MFLDTVAQRWINRNYPSTPEGQIDLALSGFQTASDSLENTISGINTAREVNTNRVVAAEDALQRLTSLVVTKNKALEIQSDRASRAISALSTILGD